jgi:hypothetical protein
MVQDEAPVGLQSALVPELGTGVLPSVVYQIEVFAFGSGVVAP